MHHAVTEIFLWLFGLCVGSFLNVVVYRLEARLSIARPVRSFCPCCRAGIAWFDNVPVLSWCLLRGRCRHCRAPISVQYPLVEALTGLIFVLTYHLLCAAPSRAGLPDARLPTDLPLLLSWLALAAGLIACAALDLLSYTVDVRITNAVLVVGILSHVLWPRPDFFASHTAPATAAGALAAFLAAGVLMWITAAHAAPDEDEESAPTPEPPTPEPRAARFGGAAGSLLLVVLAVWLILIPAVPDLARAVPHDLPIVVPLAAVFLVTVLVGSHRRPADEEIKTAIEEERPHARRMALRELLWLSPAIIAAAAALALIALVPGARAGWEAALRWTPAGDFAPVGGLTTAVGGAVIAAATGWFVRILFTLSFGREAFGVGDIHILAAIGAAAGWDMALLGFILSIGIALAGVLLGLLLKSTTIIPLGPWLGLGVILALWWSRPAASLVKRYWGELEFAWQRRPELLLAAAGLLLVVFPLSVILSRVITRAIIGGRGAD